MRKGLLIGLILLIGLVIAADRVGVLVAEDEIAKNVASQYHLQRKPDVSIHGFPFLTQAIGGEYDQIDVDLGDLQHQDIRLKDVKVELRGVTAPLSDALHGDTSNIAADTATSVATVPYEVVNRHTPRGMKVSSKNSTLVARGRISMLGLSSNVTARVKVEPYGRSVRAVPESVDAGGAPVPGGVARRFFTFTVPVTVLPVGTRVSKVEVQDDGLRISMTADNVKLSSLNIR